MARLSQGTINQITPKKEGLRFKTDYHDMMGTQRKPQKSYMVEIAKEQTETIDRLLMYKKTQQDKLKKSQIEQQMREKETLKKITMGNVSKKLAQRAILRQFNSLGEEDPIRVQLFQRDTKVQCDFNDLKPLVDVIKCFKRIVVKKPELKPKKDKPKNQWDINKDKKLEKDEKQPRNIPIKNPYAETQEVGAQTDITFPDLIDKLKANEQQGENIPQQENEVEGKNDNKILDQDEGESFEEPSQSGIEDKSEVDNQSQIQKTDQSMIKEVEKAQQIDNQSSFQTPKKSIDKKHTQAKSDDLKVKGVYLPIQYRYKIEQRKKEEWLRSQEMEAKEREEKSILSVMGERRQNNQSVNFENFFDEQQRWLEKKNENLLKERIKKNETQIEDLTFRPQLNEKSIKLAKNLQTSRTTEERLIQYDDFKKYRRQVQQVLQSPQFHPFISPKSKQMLEEQKHRERQGLSMRLHQTELEDSAFVEEC